MVIIRAVSGWFTNYRVWIQTPCRGTAVQQYIPVNLILMLGNTQTPREGESEASCRTDVHIEQKI